MITYRSMPLLSAMVLIAAQTAGIAGEPHPDTAAPVYGTVKVCYYSTECPFANTVAMLRATRGAQNEHNAAEHTGAKAAPQTATSTPVDAPAFSITNTGRAPLLGVSFAIAQDSSAGVVRDVYSIGKIAAGASVVIIPGASNDKKVHPSGGFFTFTGSPLDTSDSGPDANSIEFVAAGKAGTQALTTGPIKVSKFLRPSTDGTVKTLNFLGGPGNADGPCNDCYPITQIGTLVAVETVATKPEN